MEKDVSFLSDTMLTTRNEDMTIEALHDVSKKKNSLNKNKRKYFFDTNHSFSLTWPALNLWVSCGAAQHLVQRFVLEMTKCHNPVLEQWDDVSLLG